MTLQELATELKMRSPHILFEGIAMDVELYRWYANRSRQDKKGTKASSHKPQYGIYYYPLYHMKPSSIPSTWGFYLAEGRFSDRFCESIANEAFENGQFVVWMGSTSQLWEKLQKVKDGRSIIKLFFETDFLHK
jgi:hypothetical protein